MFIFEISEFEMKIAQENKANFEGIAKDVHSQHAGDFVDLNGARGPSKHLAFFSSFNPIALETLSASKVHECCMIFQ